MKTAKHPNTQTPKQPNSQTRSGWRCGVVSLSPKGFERFEERDLPVIDWLNTQLLQRINSDQGEDFGSRCYHLKGRGGVSLATQDLEDLLSGSYPYVIRSDAKGYYAHIRHHQLVGLLKDYGFGREVCHVTTQLCQRMVVRRGIYSECRQGIPLGCAASPALAAIYLSPLDNAMTELAGGGVKYIRYMDDWVILCPSRHSMRRAVKLMHQTLDGLGLTIHPDKTFIGKAARGFDFLGTQFQAGERLLSQVSKKRLSDQLTAKFSHAARLYEQGRLHSLKQLELYLTHWLRWSKGIGIGIASQTALDASVECLKILSSRTTDVMKSYFCDSMMEWLKHKTHAYYNITKKTVPSHDTRNHRRVTPSLCLSAGSCHGALY